MTLGYKVMIESNSGKRPSGFDKYGGPNRRQLRHPQKMNLVCSVLHLCQISCL